MKRTVANFRGSSTSTATEGQAVSALPAGNRPSSEQMSRVARVEVANCQKVVCLLYIGQLGISETHLDLGTRRWTCLTTIVT